MEFDTLGKFDTTDLTMRKRSLLGTDQTTNGGHPDVLLATMDDKDETSLMCTATGFNTADITVNIKKNHCVLTEEDGVGTSGLHQNPDGTFWRENFVKCLKADVHLYSCEVSHTECLFRQEKLWDPESDGGGRIISSKFMETTPPLVNVFARSFRAETDIFSCKASDFYPNKEITMKMKRNGRILTREDGVKSSRVCSNEDGTFQRTDSVEIKKIDKSNFSCEVVHAASGSRFEKFWDRQLLPPTPPGSDGAGDDRDKRGATVGGLMGVLSPVLVFFLLLFLVTFLRRRFFEAATRFKLFFTSALLETEDSPPGTSVYSDGEDENKNLSLLKENV